MLGKLPVPGRPTNLDYSRARAYCACSRCGWGCLDILLSSTTSFLSPSLWETARLSIRPSIHLHKLPLALADIFSMSNDPECGGAQGSRH